MKEWIKISLLLSTFGFMRNFNPSEPFLTEYILGPWRNITKEELNKEIYPVSTYSYASQLVLVFLITDFLRYKPLIICMGLSGIIIWSLLLWTTSYGGLIAVECFYGTYMASEVAYYTYIYAKVDKCYYPKVTSHSRAGMLAGKLFGGILSQILIYFHFMNYKELNYITFTAQICATLWAFTLPNIKTSLYFHRKNSRLNSLPQNDSLQQFDKDQEFTSNNNNISSQIKLTSFKLIWSHFYNAYTNVKVLQWSMWYAVGLCGHLQVSNYIQVLWKSIDNKSPVVWNGAVEAIITLGGTLFSILAGYLHAGKLNPHASLIVLAILSILEGSSLILTACTSILYISYIGYIIFGSLFAFTIAVSSAEVARHLEEDSFGLVFGINTLVALILQTIITVIVVSDGGLGLDIITQFIVYGSYFLVIGFLYIIAMATSVVWINFC